MEAGRGVASVEGMGISLDPKDFDAISDKRFPKI
jgi:hypothetical protein